MTISSENNTKTFIGDGTNNALATDFPFILAADIIVTSRVIATAVETTLVLNTHYTILGTEILQEFPPAIAGEIYKVLTESSAADLTEDEFFARLEQIAEKVGKGMVLMALVP